MAACVADDDATTPTITADTAPREALDPALVWLAQVVPDVTALETLGILAPGEPLPGRPPDVVPQPDDPAAELRRILGGLGRVDEI